MRALVVEDDATMALLIERLLQDEGFAVDRAGTAADGEALACVTTYDAIILDLGLPDRNGLTVLQALRRVRCQAPVLILTARNDSSTTVHALDCGADDYVRKPIVFDEFRARIRALVRRGGSRRSELLIQGNLSFDRLKREAMVKGSKLRLTPKEIGMLEHLLLHSGQVVSRTTLLEKVWDLHFDPGTNVIDVTTARLRKKLVESGADVRILARRGIGFVLDS